MHLNKEVSLARFAADVERTRSNKNTNGPFVVDFIFRTFAETFHSLCPEKPWVTKLSSAGLVYVHFGRKVLAELTKLKEQDRQLEVLYDKVKDDCFSNIHVFFFKYGTEASIVKPSVT